jgi:geranylgeranyl diphosphate synthase type II
MAQHTFPQIIPEDASSLASRVEHALECALRQTAENCPPTLARAMRYAVFPGGARLRPSLCLTVALASGDPRSDLADAAATALELVHCASLVHDDLPCFDDAALRRGVPTVHKVFGQPIAVLVGDALIVQAFDTLARTREPELIRVLAKATGPAGGIIAGQAWESEPSPPIEEYQRAKTAALFEAAACMGAVATGGAPEPWRAFGELVGRAYQAADDLVDALKSSAESGKSSGRDGEKKRPSVVRAFGVEAARRRVRTHLETAAAAAPSCPHSNVVRSWLGALANRLELS